MGLLTPCSVPRGGSLYTMTVPGGRVFAPFKSCPGGMVMDEIDTCIIRNCSLMPDVNDTLLQEIYQAKI